MNSQFLRKNRKDILTAFWAILCFIVFIPIFTYLYFAKDLKSADYIMNRSNTGVVLVDRNEKMFFKFYEAKYKIVIPFSEINLYVKQAMLVAEDKEFYVHPGFSTKSIMGALIANIKSGGLKYGGSTITQQLVKNTLLSSERNFLRKYQELVLAQEIERRFSKDEIFAMYLNSVYFGEGAFGIEEAAKTYFNTSAKKLTLSQSAFLASLPTAPSKLSPFSGDGTRAVARQRFILKEMEEQRYITPQQRIKAEQEKLVFNTHPQESFKAPHFALMVRDELIKKYGEEFIARSGFKVQTTLDLDWQEYAEKIVAQQVRTLQGNRVSNGAVVVMDPKTGEIRALVGSKDWFDNKFGKVNIATSLRQPGSSFKPIVYADAFQRGVITPATILKDMPTTYKSYNQTYAPKNYDGKFRGPVVPRRALANSLNVPSVEVLSKDGVLNALNMAKKLGITSLQDESNYGLSLVLGAGEVKLLELTNVYATFANMGEKNTPTTILKIENKRDEVIYRYQPKSEKVIDPKYAFLISSILSDNKARQEVFGNALTISRPAAVKTGTTENYRDSWTLGYTPSLTIGVWVGNNDGTLMDNIAGSLGAAPIWKSLMEHFLASTPVEQFDPPADLVQATICSHNGLLAKTATSSALVEYFVKGTEPTRECNPVAPSLSTPGNPYIPVSPSSQGTVSPTGINTPFPTTEQNSPSPQTFRIEVKNKHGKIKI